MERKCSICNESNFDVLEEHLLALAGEEAEDKEWSPPLYLTLCVNCHRIIHRCCWVLIGEDSQLILDKYFALLESLPATLSKKLESELRAAIDSVIRQYQRAGIEAPEKVEEGKKCVLCGNSNPDLLEEHLVVSREEQAYLDADIIVDVCASCHRIVLKFYEGKVLPSSSESKQLLFKYLTQFEKYLPASVKRDLAKLCQE